jgi:hypothetical protein
MFAPIAAQTDFAVPPQITIPSSLLEGLLSEVASLKEEIAQLRDERAQDRVELDRFKATHKTFAIQTTKDIDQLFDVTEKATRVPVASTPTGKTTVSRIAKLKDFLKARSGGATFQECERLLSIRPNQMTKLVSMLDKRRFEVFTRAGDGRQRVLRLKAQIVSRER